jgi:4-hydroxybenzoate polyprenyltransferase
MTTRAGVRRAAAPVALLQAAHIGPALAVTAITALLASGEHLTLTEGVVVTGAVLAGQLTIGWGNDLLDAGRDRQVGRTDKPLANGELVPGSVLPWLAVAAAACVVLSLLAGWRSGLTHLLLLVAFGHLYNVYFKATPWSWLPYAVAFGSLPAVVTLAGEPAGWPPAWMVLVAASLGVAAHFLNALPDLVADEATGIRGLPHRIGASASRAVATTLLLVASGLAVLGPAGAPGAWAWPVLAAVAALAVLALVGQGKVPFYAAITIALADVMLLTVVDL